MSRTLSSGWRIRPRAARAAAPAVLRSSPVLALKASTIPANGVAHSASPHTTTTCDTSSRTRTPGLWRRRSACPDFVRACHVSFPTTLSAQAFRYQRSVSNRPSGGAGWREKVRSYDRQQEEQRRAEEAEARRLERLRGGSGNSMQGAKASALRRQRRKAEGSAGPGSFDFFRGEASDRQEDEGQGGSSSYSSSSAHQQQQRSRMRLPGAEFDAHHDTAQSNPAAVPGYSFWQSVRMWFKGSRDARGVRAMPINPLHKLKKTSSVLDKHASNPDAGHVSRFLLAIEELHGRSKKRNETVTAQLSDDQKRDIVARYAETRWWGSAYKPFKSVSDMSVKRSLRFGRLVVALCMLAALSLLMMLYKQEMRMISELSPEDRRDYAHMVLGMRQGDLYELANEVLSKEDPLYALPDAARCHILLEEARKRNWHQIDWEVERRNTHPDSALAEGDYMHLMYWAAMTLGSMVYGGSTVFNEKVFRFAEEERDREHREPGQQLEPTAKPETTRRSFFS